MPRYLISVGLGLIVFGSPSLFGFEITFPIKDSEISIYGGESGNSLGQIAGWTGLWLVVIATLLVLFDYFDEKRQLKDRIRICIELRGLDLTIDRSIKGFLTKKDKLYTESRIIDLRKNSPEDALSKVKSIPEIINLARTGNSGDQVDLYIGGMAPVPLLFLAGSLVTNQSKSILLDWNRDQQSWSELTEPDDGNRFEINGLGDHLHGLKEVVLSVSTSYAADDKAIKTTFNNLPVVELNLSNKSVNSHWSAAKQEAIAAEFRDALIEVQNYGVELIHCVIAAQASVAIRFGLQCHTRNLPELRVYQYERSEQVPYPWAIRISPSKEQATSIVKFK